MITYENECCGCAVPAYPCMGDACPNRNVPHLYCDRCKEEADTLYEYENGAYTGREIKNLPISFILRGCPEYGLKDGYCIL